MLNINHPLIFLDTTGPLISRTHERAGQNRPHYPYVSPTCCDRLQEIVDQTDAQVVITSSYARGEVDLVKLTDFLRDYGIPVLGFTPDLSGGDWRENEIGSWLTSHLVLHDCFVILDDQTEDLQSFEDHVVAIDGESGLVRKDVQRAVAVIEKFRPTLNEVKNLTSIERLQLLKKKGVRY